MAVLPGHTPNRMPEVYQGASPNARFLAGSLPADETSWQQYAQRTAGSVLTHIIALLLIVYAVTRIPAVRAAADAFDQPKDIVYVALPGPGGGGGGGGNRTPEPPRKVELPGKEKITVPVTKPPKLEPPKDNKVEPPLTIPAQPMAAAVETLPGAISAVPSVPSQGAGSGGGAGTGNGTGSGPGQGSGLGPGYGGGTGGGPYRPGNGVTSPRLITEVKPTYTGEAMRAKIQGIVTMEAVVNIDGSVSSVRITRSLDDRFGLDQEAVTTVKKWRFAPGTRLGLPVPVLVEIEMQFTLR